MSKQYVKYSSFEQFSKEQLQSNRLLFVYHNTVYDLSTFIEKHPGGRQPLNMYKGKDLENIFFNPSIHKHSKQALETLEKYKCGIIEQKLQQQTIMNSKSTAITTSNITKKSSSVNDTKSQPFKKSPIKISSQSMKPKNNEERLNQSMSRLNQSMTSSIKSQFLTIPTQQEVIQQQKLKQKQMMQQWKQSEIEELKRQQAEVQEMKTSQNQDRKVKSEIITIQKKIVNPYYQAWLDKQRQQQTFEKILPQSLTQSTNQDLQPQESTKITNSLTQSVIIEKKPKKVNIYYEEWKRKQALLKQEEEKVQQQLQQSIILEENESQISGQPSSVNNSFQRSFSLYSQRTIVQEEPHIYVPIFSPKFISPLKQKWFSS